ncbi:MAG: cell surface protein SprA, partial [Crocinitomicaceae bacterium]|nr:cell surface protein SprA [Crocinitomicaceae bacterium]
MSSVQKYLIQLVSSTIAFMVIWTVNAAPNSHNYSYYDSFRSGVDFYDSVENIQSSFFRVEVDSPDVDLIYPIEDPLDPSQNPNNIIDFEIPDNINNSIIYDPETGDYLFNSTVGEDFDYRNSSFMTQDEFFEYNLEKSLSDYWEDQVAGEDLDQSSLIPELNVGGKKFQDIFGSNKINIQPQGSAELRFGLNISKTDNPQLPERQRRITTFDFDEKIQLNVTGQIGEKLKLQTSYNTEATFDFENQMKLEYTGFEDEIIKKIEAGNVSLPLSGSLIQGGSSLFGIKT